MAFPSLENALSKVSNRYLLVVLAAKRARQLNRGAVQCSVGVSSRRRERRVRTCSRSSASGASSR